MDSVIQDERFSFIAKDPRFKPIPLKERKVKIDKRFQAMFKDKKFKLKYTMDKYGRPMQHTSSEDLKKFYELSTSDSESENESKGNEKCSKNKKKSSSSPSKKVSSHNIEYDGKPEVIKSIKEDKFGVKSDKFKEKKVEKMKASKVKRASKSCNIPQDSESSTEEESESSTSVGSDSESDNDFDHKWGELDGNAPRSTEVTSRLAVCHMDWDRIQAQDLFILFNSFKPKDGVIKSVKIYPSEFGLQRMKEEELHGPKELVERKVENDDEEAQNDDNVQYHAEKLRTYQLNRLKYYYAVVECDSPQTANVIYGELDGMEYECSSACLDLRFIPDDENFDHEPSSVADSLPDMSTYSPSLFITSALQQANVHLTWDETDPRRTEIMQHAFNDAEKAETDLQTYLASSPSSSSSENESLSESENESLSGRKLKDQIAKYKSLIQSLEEEENKKNENDVEMEISWEPGLKETAQELVKAKQKKEENLTPWEQYIEKKKKKKKQKQKERKIKAKEAETSDLGEEIEKDSILESSDDNRRGMKYSSMKKKSKENKRNKGSPVKTDSQMAELHLMMAEDTTSNVVDEGRKQKKKLKRDKIKDDNFEVNVKDPRFSAVYTSHDFNIDPSDPHFKDTKGTKALVEEKQRLLKEEPSLLSRLRQTEESKETLSSEAQQLITSIKRKTQNIQNRKRKAII